MSNRPMEKDQPVREGLEFGFQGEEAKKPETDADHLYTLLKPLHNLPRGKNTWNPSFLKKWWFWPLSLLVLILLHNLYPLLLRLFAGPQ
jgi:hypothetical protein